MMNSVFCKTARRTNENICFSYCVRVPPHWSHPPLVRVWPGCTRWKTRWTTTWGWSESGIVWVPSSSPCAASDGPTDAWSDEVKKKEKKKKSKGKGWFCCSRQTRGFAKKCALGIVEFHVSEINKYFAEIEWQWNLAGGEKNPTFTDPFLINVIWPIKAVSLLIHHF